MELDLASARLAAMAMVSSGNDTYVPFCSTFVKILPRKHHLNLCWQCFPKYAKDIGFQKLD